MVIYWLHINGALQTLFTLLIVAVINVVILHGLYSNLVSVNLLPLYITYYYYSIEYRFYYTTSLL